MGVFSVVVQWANFSCWPGKKKLKLDLLMERLQKLWITPTLAHLGSLHLHITWQYYLGNQYINTFLIQSKFIQILMNMFYKVNHLRRVLKLMQTTYSMASTAQLQLDSYEVRVQFYNERGLVLLSIRVTHTSNWVSKLMLTLISSGFTCRCQTLCK